MSLIDKAVSLCLPAVPKPVVRHFSSRYIAGPTMEDAFRVVRDLEREGAMATLDILGEFIETPEAAAQNSRAYEDLVRRIAQERLAQASVSVKLTALGLLQDKRLCLENMRRLLGTVREHGNFVCIDMEDSQCTSATLEIHAALRKEFPGLVGTVLQSRLRRTVQDADEICREPAVIRLCKGIYLEPRRVAYTEPELIRRNFVLILERMVEAGAYAAIATHDEILVWEALRIIHERGLDGSRYEFQMLLGVDPELRRILLREGHRLRVYVPFGEHWYPYSVRRLRENPQIAGHAFRAMFKGNGA